MLIAANCCSTKRPSHRLRFEPPVPTEWCHGEEGGSYVSRSKTTKREGLCWPLLRVDKNCLEQLNACGQRHRLCTGSRTVHICLAAILVLGYVSPTSDLERHMCWRQDNCLVGRVRASSVGNRWGGDTKRENGNVNVTTQRQQQRN